MGAQEKRYGKITALQGALREADIAIRQYERHCETVNMSKSNRQLFLDNIDEIYANDCLWLSFRVALGEVECRLWDERLFRRLDREKQRLVAAVNSGELLLPDDFYSKMAAGLKSARKPNESHVKSGKSTPLTVAEK